MTHEKKFKTPGKKEIIVAVYLNINDVSVLWNEACFVEGKSGWYENDILMASPEQILEVKMELLEKLKNRLC